MDHKNPEDIGPEYIFIGQYTHSILHIVLKAAKEEGAEIYYTEVPEATPLLYSVRLHTRGNICGFFKTLNRLLHEAYLEGILAYRQTIDAPEKEGCDPLAL